MRKIRRAPPGEERIAAFADAQSGVISLEQLMEVCELSPPALSRRVASKRLRPWAPRVYAVGHEALTWRGRAIGALLFGGDASALSHIDAGELRGILPVFDRARVHVTVPRDRRSTARVWVHVSHLDPAEIEVVRGLPGTCVARTVLDLADTSSERLVEQALNGAEVRGLLRLDELEATIARGNGRRGIGRLMRAYDAHREGLTITRSEFEERFLAFLRTRRYPQPVMNEKLFGYRADFYWPRHRLVIETDGLLVHTRPGAFEHDRRRDRVHRAAGLRVERITYGDITRRARQFDAEMRPWFGRRPPRRRKR